MAKDPKPNVKVGKIEQVIDGKPYYYRLGKDGTASEMSVCCDCHLVHLMEFKPLKNAIRIRVWREDPLTDEIRAKKKPKHRKA